jgi:predicted nuclease of predicted toxin-antitoxin system
LSLRLLVDEDSQVKRLVNLLRHAGHDVVTVPEASLASALDERVLEYAQSENRILLTNNCDDFRELHHGNPRHAGIIAIHQDQDTSKNMPYAAVVRALANLEASGWDLAGSFVVLNAWNY